jgi:hypothetical protein
MKAIAALLFFALCAPAVVTATTVVPMSVEELAQHSTHVLRARATESWSEWNADHSIINTFTRFETVSAIKGAATQRVVVMRPGGTVGNVTTKVAGVHHWKSGEEAVLFLRPSGAADKTMVVTGLIQGDFRLSRTRSGEVAVSNGVAGASALQRGSVMEYRGSKMLLRELETRVRKVVAQ